VNVYPKKVFKKGHWRERGARGSYSDIKNTNYHSASGLMKGGGGFIRRKKKSTRGEGEGEAPRIYGHSGPPVQGGGTSGSSKAYSDGREETALPWGKRKDSPYPGQLLDDHAPSQNLSLAKKDLQACIKGAGFLYPLHLNVIDFFKIRKKENRKKKKLYREKPQEKSAEGFDPDFPPAYPKTRKKAQKTGSKA